MRPGIEPRTSCSASQELNHYIIAAPDHKTCKFTGMQEVRIYLIPYHLASNAMGMSDIEFWPTSKRGSLWDHCILNVKYHHPRSNNAKVQLLSMSWVLFLLTFDFLHLKFRVAHTKDDVISILMHKYTYTNMYIIKKIISCRFILCWDITSLSKPYE